MKQTGLERKQGERRARRIYQNLLLLSRNKTCSKKIFFFKQEPVGEEDLSEPPASKTFSTKLVQNTFLQKTFFFKQDPVGREDLSEPPPASKQNFVFQKSVLQKTFFFFKQEPVAEKDLSEPPAASCKKTYLFFCFSQFSALKIR